jgi:hypothetical protein
MRIQFSLTRIAMLLSLLVMVGLSEALKGAIAPAASPGMIGSSQVTASPEEAARSFYKWYLQALYESPKADPFREHKRGTLVKLQTGKQIASASIRLAYFPGD